MIDSERCKKIVNSIRDLSKTEIDELFKLLYKDHCEYTQNNNGIFFNLSWVSEETMVKIEQFIQFCNRSNTELVKYETLCDVLNHKLYENIKKDTDNLRAPKGLTIRLKSRNIIEKEKIREKEVDKTIEMNTEKDPEKDPDPNQEQEDEDNRKTVAAKISSSMRFYLLKKRFSKPLLLTSTYENDLMPEQFIM
jgi:hypothetical protein